MVLALTNFLLIFLLNYVFALGIFQIKLGEFATESLVGALSSAAFLFLVAGGFAILAFLVLALRRRSFRALVVAHYAFTVAFGALLLYGAWNAA